ncbi:DUF6541 family protein [Blastococcus sp. SYSU D00922]
MSDLAVVGTVLLALFGPGLALAACLGLRRSTALFSAPALTFALITAVASVSSYVDLPWNPWALLGYAVAACALVVVVRVLLGRAGRAASGGSPDGSGTTDRTPRRSWRPARADIAIAAGVLAGWALSATVLVRSFGSMSNVNQDWDYVFHANLVRLIADTGSANPDVQQAINDWEVQSSFYPNAFHALGAIVRDVTGAPVFTVLNAQTLMIAGVAGLGLAGLLRALRAPLAVAAATPVLLAGFASFPYDTLWRGPLLPFAMGIALIPAFFLLLHEALESRRALQAVAAGLGAAALLGVQSATALSAALIAIPFLVQRWATRPRSAARDLLPLVLTGASAVVVALPFISGVLAVNSAGVQIDWPAVSSVGQATGDLFLLNHAAPAPQYWLSGLMIVGVLSLRRARYMWWWLAGGAVSFALFVLAAASDSQRVADLTAPWWNDRWRFAAVAVLAFAPLAAHGLQVLAETADALLRRVLDRRNGGVGTAAAPPAPAEDRADGPSAAPAWRRESPARVPVLAALGLAAVFLLSSGLYVNANTVRTSVAYQGPGQLDPREIQAMRWLSQQPGADGEIMNDPNDGSPYMLALFGIDPVFGHIVSPGTAAGETQRLLLEHFNCLDSDTDLRSAVEDLGITYVFVSSGYVRAEMTRYAGLRDLRDVQSLEKVYEDRGGLRIYRVALTPEPSEPIEACSLPTNP